MNILPRKVIGQVQPTGRTFPVADVLILGVIIAILFGGIRLASTVSVSGPDIDLSPGALPYYAFLSMTRMTASYIFSLIFTLVYGYFAARSLAAERFMLPILDVLASVPLLSFLPVILLITTTLLPGGLAIEFTAVLMIFSCQAWNMVYSFYQSIRNLPPAMKEASGVFRFNWWYRFRFVELPFGAVGLLWNSMMSWANGWFFLMAAETFRVGEKDFRLPGLGSYLQAAANESNAGAIVAGMFTLILIIVLLDQLIWRPLLAWAEKFKVELVENDNPTTSWFFDFAGRSSIVTGTVSFIVNSIFRWLDRRLGGPAQLAKPRTKNRSTLRRIISISLMVALVGILAYGLFVMVELLTRVPLSDWGTILLGTLSTGLRNIVSLVLSLLWTIPVGVAIGTNPRLSKILQPVVQIAAAVPATGLFPVLVLAFISLPLGLNGAAIMLMLLGTQWYLLFNIIAGVSALPQDLKDTVRMFRIGGWLKWRTLILPTIFPFVVTGAVAASAGVWNASIVAEYTEFGGKTYSVLGLGSIIAQATADANYPLLLAATLTMIIVVIGLNRFFWRRWFRLAEDKYQLDD